MKQTCNVLSESSCSLLASFARNRDPRRKKAGGPARPSFFRSSPRQANSGKEGGGKKKERKGEGGEVVLTILHYLSGEDLRDQRKGNRIVHFLRRDEEDGGKGNGTVLISARTRESRKGGGGAQAAKAQWRCGRVCDAGWKKRKKLAGASWLLTESYSIRTRKFKKKKRSGAPNKRAILQTIFRSWTVPGGEENLGREKRKNRGTACEKIEHRLFFAILRSGHWSTLIGREGETTNWGKYLRGEPTPSLPGKNKNEFRKEKKGADRKAINDSPFFLSRHLVQRRTGEREGKRPDSQNRNKRGERRGSRGNSHLYVL